MNTNEAQPDVAAEENSAYKELLKIEQEFKVLIHKDRQNWIRAAKLLDRIEEGQFYQMRTTSFTQYVRWLAHENNINVSTLWRARSAARTYCQLKGVALENIYEKSVKSTPEQLEYFGKVQTIAPSELVEQVKERMLKGEKVRHELRNLWQTYRPLKGGKTERGRKPKPEETQPYITENTDQFFVPFSEQETDNNEDIAAHRYLQSLKNKEKLEKYKATPEELTEANIKHALYSDFWIREHFKSAHKIDVQINLDLTTWKLGFQPERLQVPAVGFARAINAENGFEKFWLFTVALALASEVDWDELMGTYAPFGDFAYLAIPKQAKHLENVLKRVPHQVGVLTVDKSLSGKTHMLQIVRMAKKQSPALEQKQLIMEALLKQQLGWQ